MKNNSLTISIVSPRVSNNNQLQKFNFLTLDYGANNQENNQLLQKKDVMSKTLYNNYDNKKFKIRAPVQSVKTARIRSYQPFTRIKKVQELIKKQKQYEILQEQSNNANKKELNLMDLSPKNKILKKLLEKDNIFKVHKQINIKTKLINSQQQKKIGQRIQQIQTVIKKIKKDRESHVKQIRLDTAAVPKRQNRIKIQNIQFDLVNVSFKQNQFSERVKNTKRLNQRGRNRSNSHKYSLLSRINKLNEYQQNFVHFYPSYHNRGSIQVNNSQSLR